MLLFKAPDPGAYSVTADGRVYPVRDGVFLAEDDINPNVAAGFELADNVRDDLVVELRELGSHEAEKVEEHPLGDTAVGADLSKIGARLKAAEKLALSAHEHAQHAHDRIDAIENAEPIDGEESDDSIAARIDAVSSHDEANALAAELGVDGFEAKKPSIDAKKAALHAKAEELAA